MPLPYAMVPAGRELEGCSASISHSRRGREYHCLCLDSRVSRKTLRFDLFIEYICLEEQTIPASGCWSNTRSPLPAGFARVLLLSCPYKVMLPRYPPTHPHTHTRAHTPFARTLRVPVGIRRLNPGSTAHCLHALALMGFPDT